MQHDSERNHAQYAQRRPCQLVVVSLPPDVLLGVMLLARRK